MKDMNVSSEYPKAAALLQIGSGYRLKMCADVQQKLEASWVYFEQPSKKKNKKAEPLTRMARKQDSFGW